MGSGYVSDYHIIHPYFKKTYVSFSYTSYLYQHSIDFQISNGVNTNERKNSKLYRTS